MKENKKPLIGEEVIFDTMPGTIEPLHAQSLEEITRDLFSKNWGGKVTLSVSKDDLKLEDGTQLYVTPIGWTCKGKFTEAHVQRFMDGINKAIDAGDIEYGAIAPVQKIDLYDPPGTPGFFTNQRLQERWMLVFYPLSRYSMSHLKEKYGCMFTEEGEAPSEVFTADAQPLKTGEAYKSCPFHYCDKEPKCEGDCQYQTTPVRFRQPEDLSAHESKTILQLSKVRSN